MLYLVCALAGIGLGLISGGKLSNLYDPKLNKTWLFVLAFVLQGMTRVFSFLAANSLVAAGLNVAAGILLILGFWFNKKQLGLLVIGIGYLLNLSVMAANGMRMPISRKALDIAGLNHTIDLLEKGLDGKHSLLTDDTRLAFLADIINLPAGINLGMPIVSLGDIVVAFGLLILLFKIIRDKRVSTETLRGGNIHEKIN